MTWAGRIVLTGCMLTAAVGGANVAYAANQQPSRRLFLDQNPGVRLYLTEDRVTRVYGRAWGGGADAGDSARTFVAESSLGLFDAPPEDLPQAPQEGAPDGVQPVLYDDGAAAYRYSLVRFEQSRRSVPVFRADLRLLVLNQPGYPVVLAASTLKPLADFAPQTDRAEGEADWAASVAREAYPQSAPAGRPRLIIWAGTEDSASPPRLAYEVMLEGGPSPTGEPFKRLLLIDAAGGEVLYEEDQVRHADIVGTVTGMATEGWGADLCGEELPTAMPYARVQVVGGNTAFADSKGDFVIPHAGSEPVIVQSEVRGQWFAVTNLGGPNSVLEQVVVPPGPADFQHNALNIEEPRAEVNAYLHANIVRDFALRYNPSYPGLGQQAFPVNVNIAAPCNAFYDGASINFFHSTGVCANTAFSVVVHHEYGHHLVQLAGSGQGQYGEGAGDVMGVLISDDPVLAYGFENNCNVGIRTADNNLQYPCGGEIHYCGQLISGCVWSTREELVRTRPGEYRDILGSLWVNSMLLHRGTQITPQITIDWLTLDDDDANLDNGTPHYPEIAAGFGAHNMDAPPINEPGCGDIRKLGARCRDGTLKVKVVLTSTTFDGHSVEVRVNGAPHTLVIDQDRALLRLSGRSGLQDVELSRPAGCGLRKTADCG